MNYIKKELFIKSMSIDYFLLEKEILHEVKHPFIIKMDYVVSDADNIYYFLEYLPTGSLFAHWVQTVRCTEDQVRFISAQLILALGHLHAHGYAHRNLTIKNILFDGDGYVVLTGFSGAKKISAGDGEKKRFFVEDCQDYYSPEMLSGDCQDQTVDWWMLGILMYRMLVGVSPFHELNEDDIPHAIMHKQVEFPGDLRHFQIDISSEVQDIISHLLDKSI